MDITFLRNFTLVVEQGSMSEAARSLDMTPAAIAQQIKALERTLKAKLLQRAGRTVKPTQAGLVLYEHAKPLLKGFEGLTHAVNIDPFKGELRLGAINTALLSFLPQTLKAFSRDYPKVRVSIVSGHSLELISLLEDNAIDAAICIHPNFSFSKSLRWDTFRHEPLTLLAPAGSTHSTPDALLTHYPLIRYDRNLSGGKQADHYLKQNSPVKLIECVELSSILAIALMVECGLGVSVVPDINSKLLDGLAIQKIPLKSHLEQRSIGMLSHQNSFKKPLLEHLVHCHQLIA